jgi:diguanylate cyclase
MVDLDHLKHINDAFGHAAGDHAIRLAAAAVLSGVEGEGDVARVGGDEFAVIVPGLGARDAQSLGRIG